MIELEYPNMGEIYTKCEFKCGTDFYKKKFSEMVEVIDKSYAHKFITNLHQVADHQFKPRYFDCIKKSEPKKAKFRFGSVNKRINKH